MRSLRSQDDWKWVKLGEACSFIGGGTPSKKEKRFWNGSLFWASVKDVKGDYLYSTEDTITEKGLKSSSSNVADPDDVLIVTRISPGKSIITKVRTAINQDLKIVKPKFNTSSKFISYFFKSVERQLVSKSSGTTVLGITLTNLNEIKIPILSIETQRAIVSKIEELFSELDKGIENLRIAQQQLKTYRQSVLKWAFEGKLTNENVKEGELLNGWKVLKLNDIGEWKGGGTPSKVNKAFWEKGNILWVSPKDMKSKIIHDTIDKITLDAIENSSTKLISRGSILFVVRSGILRRTLPVAITICDVTVNQDLQAFTPNGVLPDYVYWYAQAKNEDIRRDCSKDGTTVESIESSLLKNYLIPICSYEEQNKIVQAIESRLSVADKMEESITQSLQQAEALRQSILKKAFEGSLV